MEEDRSLLEGQPGPRPQCRLGGQVGDVLRLQLLLAPLPVDDEGGLGKVRITYFLIVMCFSLFLINSRLQM